MSNRLSILLVTALAAISLAPAAEAQRLGSIYDPNRGPVRLVSNKTASRIGDLVTVVISETQDVRNEEKSDLKKESSLDYQLLNFDINQNAFQTLPHIQTEKDEQLKGNATYEKKGNFTARLTAIVMDSLPNGNLVIQGRREIRIDAEVKVIEFSGIIRRYDITVANSIQSELVADARVTYTGNGPLTKSTNRIGLSRWLTRAIDWIWPF